MELVNVTVTVDQGSDRGSDPNVSMPDVSALTEQPSKVISLRKRLEKRKRRSRKRGGRRRNGQHVRNEKFQRDNSRKKTHSNQTHDTR